MKGKEKFFVLFRYDDKRGVLTDIIEEYDLVTEARDRYNKLNSYSDRYFFIRLVYGQVVDEEEHYSPAQQTVKSPKALVNTSARLGN